MKQSLHSRFAIGALIIIALALVAHMYLLTTRSSLAQNHAELGYYNTSPLGEAGGRSVPASCPSYPHGGGGQVYGGSCSVSNVCGTNYGLYNCDGQCSAIAPPVPSNYGQACSNSICGDGTGTIGCDGQCRGSTGYANAGQACSSGFNACGMSNSGTYQCDGTCSAQRPSDSLCDGTEVNLLQCGDGICSASETPWSCPSDCGAPPRDVGNCSLTLTPNRIIAGTRTVVAWSSQNAGSCTITGVSQEDGTQIETFTVGGTGSRASTQLDEDAIYSMVCTAADTGGASCTVTEVPIEVVPLPQWQET